MIDLHMHSKYSDGSYTITELLEKAEEKDLEMMSITDHETCKGHIELRDIDAKKYFSGEIIRGVEVKAFYKGRVIDILGYNINIDNMEEWLTEFYKDRTFEMVQLKYLDYYYKVCKNLGIKLTPRDQIEWNPKEWANIFLYSDIKKYPENEKIVPKDLWEDYQNFRHHYCYNPKSEFYIDKSNDFPNLHQTIASIKDNGGISFLAHAYMYKWATDKPAFIKDIVDNYHIDGIECYYSRFTEEEHSYVMDLCKRRKLHISGGSDFHGERSPGIDIGIGKGNLSVPFDITKTWI